MTDSDDGDDAFDVLLHDAAQAGEAEKNPPIQQSRVTARAARSARGHWLPWAQAAAALFAIGVVIAISSLRRPESMPAMVVATPAQDPQKFRPKSTAELDTFVASIVSLRFCTNAPTALARDRRTILTGNDDTTAVDVTDREQVEQWRGRIRAAFGETKPYDTFGDALVVEMVAADGRKVSGSLILKPQARLDFASGGEPIGPFEVTGELLADCQAIQQRIQRQRHLRDGNAASAEDLATFPDTQERLGLAVDRRIGDLLRRFTALTALSLHPEDGSGQEPPDGGTLRALSELPLANTLRAVSLRGDWWTEHDFVALGKWPELRTLTLQDMQLPPRVLQTFGRLERLELLGCRAAEPTALPPGLNTLVLEDRGRPLPVDVAAAVRSLPSLRELTLIGKGFDDALLGAMLQSRVHALRLLDTSCSWEGLAALKGLPTLRRLTLSGAGDLDSIEPFASLGQLTDLEVWNVLLPADGLDALRAALPKCRVEGRPDMVPVAGGLLLQRLRGCAF
ncbi:MAG: hypothetical protein IPK26_19610 [Planctomycetes bacterium]|nr:hypothetical protein [Planctomycetota bacterium]